MSLNAILSRRKVVIENNDKKTWDLETVMHDRTLALPSSACHVIEMHLINPNRSDETR